MRKWRTMLLAGLLTFMINVPALAQDVTAPKPPGLYSAAALLMDADTGQVIWGKNKNTTMYPASLTKIMTCLLAMERGNPADIVTMTDEGVFSVPRATTHAALTPGEQLTLEQLEFIMMVESANDAANGIAIHLAGSIPAFAALMNTEAARIGAKDTHFTNANGLPDAGHYTTAYDLGLVTREALTHPEFRTLAGTKVYEMPPTNLQPQTRKFNNRQYMFCLNDTYPGAFAGKTGWTEEAGKTLITIAERDGVTLIAVVLKAAGAVDAEFKDSTALLDYGFKNFRRVMIPKDKIPAASLAVGGDSFTLDTDMPVLLPIGATSADVTVKVDTDSAAVRLFADDYAASMEVDLGAFALTKKAAPVVAPAPVIEKKPNPWLSIKIPPQVVSVLIWIGASIAAFLVFILCLRMCVRRIVRARRLREQQERELRRKRARTRAALQLAREQAASQGILLVDVRQNKTAKNRITVIRDDHYNHRT